MTSLIARGLPKEDEITNLHPEEILVIGAGLPRTGTLSLKTALVKLYKGKCYHMKEVFIGDQEDVSIWIDAAQGNNSAEDWRRFFKKKGYVSGCDYPFSLFWKQIADAYPNAKVVLSTRDPGTWYKSVTESIWKIHELQKQWTYRLMFNMFDSRKGSEKMFQLIGSKPGYGMNQAMGEAIEAGPEVTRQYFIDWQESVKNTIAPERLLVHSAKEGWGPLCKFLGVPVPDGPYPRVNDSAQIQQKVSMLKRIHFVMFYMTPVLLAVSAYYRGDLVSALTRAASTGAAAVSKLFK